jgi:hypothetical protein
MSKSEDLRLIDDVLKRAGEPRSSCPACRAGLIAGLNIRIPRGMFRTFTCENGHRWARANEDSTRAPGGGS